jgi:hypothetical protein
MIIRAIICDRVSGDAVENFTLFNLYAKITHLYCMLRPTFRSKICTLILQIKYELCSINHSSGDERRKLFSFSYSGAKIESNYVILRNVTK